MIAFNDDERGKFLGLFIKGDDILDFSGKAALDTFTYESIGVQICEDGLSKVNALLAYMRSADKSKKDKLTADLFNYYEKKRQSKADKEEREKADPFNHYEKKPLSEDDKDELEKYERCKAIMSSKISSVDKLAEKLKEEFSSEYISKSIDIMVRTQCTNPTEAIGKAKELIESCCKTILENNGTNIDRRWNIAKLAKNTAEILKITPEDVPGDASEAKAIKTLFGNLTAIAGNVAEIRNSYGSGHGKSESYKGLESRYAKLAVGSSATLVQFLWDTHKTR
jgi:hypothetical protein